MLDVSFIEWISRKDSPVVHLDGLRGVFDMPGPPLQWRSCSLLESSRVQEFSMLSD